MSIQRNSATCNKCGDQLVSEHRHDFVTCQCGNLSVDGGLDYLKRTYGVAGYTETSIKGGDDDAR